VPAVGVIGLGDIGRGVANAVAASGMKLSVCDVRPEALEPFASRAECFTDPRLMATGLDAVVIAVVDDAQVLAVADSETGALATAPPGSVVIVLSTIGLDTLRRVSSAARDRGIRVVDCGVSGGPSAAADGSLVSMVGGEDPDVDAARPVIDCFSSLVVRMGPLGAGLRAKLARNVIQYCSWYAAYEAQRLAEAAGVDLTKLGRVVKESDKRIGGASTLMFRHTVAPFGPDDDKGLVDAMRAAAKLARKDLGAARQLGAELGVDLPLVDLVEADVHSLFGFSGAPAEDRT
jgi:3-hydroxyisobutyrate dehydrogenase-like beta-hydroxyacid dehydrogenase